MCFFLKKTPKRGERTDGDNNGVPFFRNKEN